MGVLGAFAQGSVKGKIKDKKTDEPLGFVNVAITQNGSDKIVNGAVTDVDGNFHIHGLANGQYVLTITFVGYKTLTRNFTISKEKKEQHYNVLFLTEDSHTLNEVTIVGQRSEMKLEVDRKSFNVDQQIANAGGAASDVLENIPSVEVDNDGNISLRGNSSVEVWINGKPSGLTSDNRAEILQQLPAESIERVEIIDNPSAKFSAEGSAGIINIDILLDYHIIDTIQIARHTDCNSLRAIFSIQREVIALLRFQVLIAETDLSLSTIHREVMVIEFVETWSTEACRVCSTESEVAWSIHQCRFRCEMLIEGLMMRQS
jgi:hypothetical protein